MQAGGRSWGGKAICLGIDMRPSEALPTDEMLLMEPPGGQGLGGGRGRSKGEWGHAVHVGRLASRGKRSRAIWRPSAQTKCCWRCCQVGKGVGGDVGGASGACGGGRVG